ncbi:MAG TPA: hypothetical protein VF773_17005 [Verrucomicrobiae bacterium]
MSAAEIIEELLKLSREEMRLVRDRMVELAAENGDVAICNSAALEGAMMLDRMEEENARGESR